MGLRILIVDDSDSFRELARQVLIGGGLDVVGTVATVAEALVAVADARPDVALVDVNLGAESGFDLARRLRASPAGTRPAVVLMSTQHASELVGLVAESPAAGFVEKQRLSARAIHEILGTSGS